MRAKTWSRLAAVAVAAWLAPACATPPLQRSEGRLVADGSSALYPFVAGAADAFRAAHPDVAFDVKHSGSGAGIKRFIERGDVDLVNSSRPVKTPELDAAERLHRNIHTTAVAAEAVAIVVHEESALDDISRDDLRAVFFSGAKREWESIPGSGRRGPITVVAIDPKVSGTGDMFAEFIGGHGRPAFVAGARVVPDNPFVPPEMTSPNVIGFCSQVVLRGTRLRAIKVDGVRPSERSILDTSYPLNRRLFVLTDGPPRGLVADFILFMLSAPGQHIARSGGLTPLTLEVAL